MKKTTESSHTKPMLSGDEFDALTPFLRNISTERLQMARLVLVDNWSYQAAGDLQNTQKQSVFTLVNRIKDVHVAWLQSLEIWTNGFINQSEKEYSVLLIKGESDALAAIERQLTDRESLFLQKKTC